jgi:hypothetical protein
LIKRKAQFEFWQLVTELNLMLTALVQNQALIAESSRPQDFKSHWHY